MLFVLYNISLHAMVHSFCMSRFQSIENKTKHAVCDKDLIFSMLHAEEEDSVSNEKLVRVERYEFEKIF